MFPSHSPQQVAIASQLLEEMDRYAEGLRSLLERRWDPDLYRALSDRFDRMQMFAESLPRLSTVWSDLLVNRVELTHALWSQRAPSRINGRVLALHAQHESLLRELRQTCRRYLTEDDVVVAPRLA